MARSWTGLYPEVCSWQNLLLAYRRCRRRKRYAPDAAEFDYDWESRLLQLQSDLASESWFPGPYRHFHISDPKPRMISAASFSDRVVHHAVVNVLEPIFEPRFVFDSYACRRGKGTHRAIDRAQYYLRRHSWTLKTDIVKFFPNVDHELLMLRLQRSLRDVRLLTLLQRIRHALHHFAVLGVIPDTGLLLRCAQHRAQRQPGPSVSVRWRSGRVRIVGAR